MFGDEFNYTKLISAPGFLMIFLPTFVNQAKRHPLLARQDHAEIDIDFAPGPRAKGETAKRI